MLSPDPDTLYSALLARDPAYDGHWYVGVSTTGIFCRLTCPARKPKREHSSFYPSARAAEAAGFRACLRCRPLDWGRSMGGTTGDLRRRVQAEPDRKWTAADLAQLGLDSTTVRRAFKREYGATFSQYARACRLAAGAARLRGGAPVIEAQLEAGYESPSGFRDAIGRLLGQAPARSRDGPTLSAAWIDTPLGAMLGVADERGIHLLEFFDRAALPGELARLQARRGPALFGPCPMLDRLSARLARYFADATAPFDLPLAQHGSDFARSVWSALQAVPVGDTRSYGDLARSLGRPEACRAVAQANGANQLAILVPCHRIVGADGSLVGYGGKRWRKHWLLEHERRGAKHFEPT